MGWFMAPSQCIRGALRELRLFLLISSVSGSAGTATVSNYCAGNQLFDALSHWRSVQHGNPTVSVGPGMTAEVGHPYELLELEVLLLRREICDDFLRIIDLALSGAAENPDRHLPTGLEPFSIRKLLGAGYDERRAPGGLSNTHPRDISGEEAGRSGYSQRQRK
ncbi:hypothetical protein HD806DRAFT_475072 [Xylariaceae sp. AK1471]|nr:hypothetical protein HD806DRAFT_475072 [Xylariaceae sp. AK1471]